MSADVCLQGGAEFQPGCEAMDAAMLQAAVGSRVRRVLVAPFAGRPGRERAVAGANAQRWYRGLGATQVEVVVDESDPFAQALARAELLVLPGGSPARLLEALAPHAEALRAATGRGTVISGASAGAMVLCRWTVLPGTGGAGPAVVPGLAVVPVDLVLVHYRGGGGPGRRDSWLDAARPHLPSGALVLGLPERSGAVVRHDATWHPVGADPVVQVEV